MPVAMFHGPLAACAFLSIIATLFAGPLYAADVNALVRYADPAEHWGTGVEAVIEAAFRRCFRTYILDGRVLTLRIPFAQNNEREELAETELMIQGGGKADPDTLWAKIDGLLASEDFRSYAAVLADGREKVMVFDLAGRKWTWTRDLFELARMKAHAYRGLPHRPHVLVSGQGLEVSDVYNYLYSVGRVGMDCSGFVWYLLSSTAAAGGADLGRLLRRALRVPRGADPSLYAGTWFFDSRSPEVIRIVDEIRNLRPGDVLLFRGSDGRAGHVALIQSIDFRTGTIRYLQSTDEAPLAERGVHESFIRFDPARPELSLRDPSLTWTKRRYPPFPGERPSAFSDDGERYRAFPEHGGGSVVRLRAMAAPLARIAAAAGDLRPASGR